MTTRITATVDPTRSRVRAVAEGGHDVRIDGKPPEGEGSAASPKEALLAALAGCTAIDVASILRKKRQAAATYEIHAEAESAEEHPRVFTSVTVEHRVTGDVTPEALRRSVELSATKYCPVSHMLSASVRIEHRYRLVAPDGAETEGLVAVTGPDGVRVER
jgi:putative redox protein